MLFLAGYKQTFVCFLFGFNQKKLRFFYAERRCFLRYIFGYRFSVSSNGFYSPYKIAQIRRFAWAGANTTYGSLCNIHYIFCYNWLISPHGLCAILPLHQLPNLKPVGYSFFWFRYYWCPSKGNGVLVFKASLVVTCADTLVAAIKAAAIKICLFIF